MEKRLPTEPEKLGLLIFHTDNPHRLYNELAQEIGYWRVPRVWHEACAWFDSMEFTDDTLPPPPDTTVSGYSVQFPQPDGPPCPVCNDTGENCHVCPPADEAEYVAAWREGAFDDTLEDAYHALQPGFWEATAREVRGYRAVDFYTLTERLYSGE